MHYGITYRNKHSSEFGVIAKTKGRSLLPDMKTSAYDMPLSDGEFDFSEANEYKRAFYKQRNFEVLMRICADNMSELQKKAIKVSHWLCGSGDLIFDDCAGVKWDAKVISNVTFTPERRGKTAELAVVFSAKPVGKAVFNTADGINLGDAVMLDSNIPFDMTDRFVYELAEGRNSVDVVNMGDFYVRPKFIFDGEMSEIKVMYGKKAIEINNINTPVVIDFERCTVENKISESLISCMSGDFFEFPSGRTSVTVYTDKPARLQIKYEPVTIYDFDFSDIDWGDDNA